MMTNNLFNSIAEQPPDPIFGLQDEYRKDRRLQKVNLSVGVYCNENLEVSVMRTVKKAEEKVFEKEKTKSYLPIEGDQKFIEKTGELLFGVDLWKQEQTNIFGVQAPGGTGALRLGAALLKENITEHIAISDPTWANHLKIFKHAGMYIRFYPYYDVETHACNFSKVIASLEKMPPNSCVLMHASCHNPTGVDLSIEEWKEVSQLCLKKKLIPFFDCAYQGIGNGIEEDVFPIRLFVKEGHAFLVAVSFSKNFGLYGERTAVLFGRTKCSKEAKAVLSKVKIYVRGLYSNPPMHGAKIVAEILSDPEMKRMWEEELVEMRHRIKKMRTLFCQALTTQLGKNSFQFLSDKIGMFCYTGLEEEKVSILRKEFGIYMTQDGRMNITGLNDHNFRYVVSAIVKS